MLVGCGAPSGVLQKFLSFMLPLVGRALRALSETLKFFLPSSEGVWFVHVIWGRDGVAAHGCARSMFRFFSNVRCNSVGPNRISPRSHDKVLSMVGCLGGLDPVDAGWLFHGFHYLSYLKGSRFPVV